MLISRDGSRLRELACSDPPAEVPPGMPAWGGPILPRMLWLDMMYLSWSPDGSKILWSVPVLNRNRVELWAVDRETGTHQTLWAGEEGYWTIPRQPSWSPQGTGLPFPSASFLPPRSGPCAAPFARPNSRLCLLASHKRLAHPREMAKNSYRCVSFRSMSAFLVKSTGRGE